MTSTQAVNKAVPDKHRLFIGSCLALIATSVAFAVIGAVMASLKNAFVLTNEQVGWIGGAALWGFAVAQLVFAPLCDTLGMRFLLRLAFVCHLIGTLVLIFASGFWVLFSGALIVALANGLVEAACNPLVATLYPEEKTVRMNLFHVWFPGGVVLGGVATYLMDLGGFGLWQAKLALILVPTIAYGFLLLNEDFPATEGVAAGVSMREMFKATFTRPLMLLMLFCMAITASTEIGPNRWLPAVLESGGIPGILVLVWISGLMVVLRLNAGRVVRRLSPTGVLLGSAVLSAGGLLWLSFAEGTAVAFLSATIFALGIGYFWPTMIGFVSERVPRSGALGLGMMGAVGMAVVGLITAPQMGRVADRVAHEHIPTGPTVELFQQVSATFPDLRDEVDRLSSDIDGAVRITDEVVAIYNETGALPELKTSNALRTIVEAETAVRRADRASATALVTKASEILGPADNYGGRVSFRYIVPFTCLLILIFGLLFLSDRKAGGYHIRKL